MWSDRRRREKSHWVRATLGIWLAIIVAGLWLLAPHFPMIVERVYSQGLYPILAAPAVVLSRQISFSTLELTLFAVLFIFPMVLLMLALRQAVQQRLGIVWGAGRTLLAWLNYAGWVWVLFAVLWGFNHFRTPLPEHLALTAYPLTEASQQQMLQAAAAQTNSLALQVDSICTLSSDVQHNNQLLNAWLAGIGQKTVPPSTARPMMLSTLATRLHVAGVYNLFLFQPTYSLAQHPALTLFTAQHELAHLAGWAGEDEASLAAYAAMWQSDEVLVRYAAWLNFWWRTGERDSLAADVLADIECIRQYEQVFEPLPVADQMWQAYDGYLQVAGGGGIKDYSQGEHYALLYFWYRVPRN